MPCETLSPILTLISFTTPASGEGISIVALSDSSVISDCSLLTASPGLTRTSITSTSLKSPMSGTRTWLMPRASYRGGIRLLGVEAVFLDGVGDGLGLALALVGERLERGDDHEVAVHLEEVAQLGARVGAAEAVGAEHAVRAVFRHEGPDLVGEGLDVVARRDHRTRRPFLQHFFNERNFLLAFGVQHVPAVS